MSSPYFGGKAAVLSANEQTVTPKGSVRSPKTPKASGMSLAKVLQDHDAEHNPHLVRAPAAPKTFGQTVKLRKQYEAGARKALAAQYGDKFTKAPGWAQQKLINDYVSKHTTRKDNRSPLEKAVDTQVTEPLLARAPKLASSKLTIPATIAGQGLAEASGVPSAMRLPGELRQNKFAAAGVEAAGLLPVGRLGKALKGAKDVEEAVKAAHTTEEAAKVRGSLRGMKVARTKQKALHSEERGARAANLHSIYTDTSLSVAEREAKANAALKGELPKVEHNGVQEDLTPDVLNTLKAGVMEHPHLMPYQKKRLVGALNKMGNGETLQPNEIHLVEHVFGKQASLTGGLKKSGFNTALSALNIPRSIMASFDLSAPFRQGLVVATRHPSIFFKNFAPMVKSFGSENVYNAVHDEIQSRASYPMMLEAKLAITKLGHAVGEREEQFASDLAEKIPVAGHGVRASGRAYTAFLDKTRADVFDHLITTAQKQGVNVQDEKFLKDLGRYINAATGRGNLQGEHLQGAAKLLNAVFFSPRLLASRVDLIFSPLTYARTDPFVRKQAIRAMFQLAGTASTLLALASQIPGVKVVTDPRNPDWGKIKKGNTRIDIGGGFQQPLRLFAQIATGEAISSTSGKKLNLTANGFGQPTRLDLILRFFEGKESPLASVSTDWLRGQNQVGQKFTWGSEAATHLTPLLAQDVLDVYRQEHGGTKGLGAAAGGAALGSLGFGLQSYGPKKPKASSGVPQSYFGGGSSGGSDYFGGSGSGGSSYFGG